MYKILLIVGVAVFLFEILTVSNKNIMQKSGNNNMNNDQTKQNQEIKAVTDASPSALINMEKTNDETKEVSKAVIKTSKGNITLELYPKEAPKTVENFVNKAKSGYYNNLTFHRVEDWVIQGGDPKGNGTGGEDMPTELNNKPFIVGSLGVARGPDIKVSNDSQFFITTKDASWLNKQYTNFGIVTEGMDVVNKIAISDKILKVEVE